MANEYDKDIMLVEVAYNWRPAEYRRNPAIPRDARGPAAISREVDRIVRARPRARQGHLLVGAGRHGSPTRGMFDDDGNALPVITVFDKDTKRQ